MPLGDRAHAADSGLADGRGRAEAVAVEGVEVRGQPGFPRGSNQERQVVAPIAGNHRVGTARLDLFHIGREVPDPTDRVQLFAHDGGLRKSRGHHAARVLGDLPAEAVVLVQEVDASHRAILGQRFHQRRHPHLDVRIEAEVPRAAALVRQRRIDGRVVQEERALMRVSLVVPVHRVDEGRGHRRTVALEDEPDVLVHRPPEHQQGLLDLPLRIEGEQLKRPSAGRQRNASARVDALDGEGEVAGDRIPGVGERAGERLDHRQPDRCRPRPIRLRASRRRHAGDDEQRRDHDRADASDSPADRTGAIGQASSDSRHQGAIEVCGFRRSTVW